MNIGYIRAATPDFIMLEQKCDEWEKNHPKMAEQYIWHLSEMIGAFLM